jgi:sulfate adenylyltransferase large subunit
VLADTPGHVQYTRNTVTGASTAELAVLLVDARHGMRPQSRRHAEIARLLGIKDYVIAVNKMDLVDFDRTVFDRIVDDFDRMLAGARLHPIPISALHGDNVTGPSERTPWFGGQPLLEFLETVEVERDAVSRPFRFPVQLVLRPTHEFRGYAGQILSGAIRRGDAVTTWPGGRPSRIRQIVTFDGDLEAAYAGQSVTLTLEDEIDISRGDMITVGDVEVAQRVRADVVWMDERPLDPSRIYLLKHTTRTVTAELDRALDLNEIGSVTVTTARPIMLDRYVDNRGTGSFVIIDPATNFTAGAGMIAEVLREPAGRGSTASAAERLARLARAASSDADAVEVVRKALEELLA